MDNKKEPPPLTDADGFTVVQKKDDADAIVSHPARTLSSQHRDRLQQWRSLRLRHNLWNKRLRSTVLPFSPMRLFTQPLAGLANTAPAPPNAPNLQDTGAMERIHMRKATHLLTVAFIVSRVLGLLKNGLFTSIFGAGPISDAYLQAFLIPDTIFTIVAGGALSSAFIPVFTRYLNSRQQQMAWHIANTSLTLATGIMMVLATLAMLCAPLLVPLYNPGVAQSEIDLIVFLLRIMLFQTIILGSGVIVTSVLNARQNFILSSFGTVLYNIGIIIGLLPGLFLSITKHPNPTFAIYAASVGVVLGALLQVGIQLPGLVKVGMRFRPSFDWRNSGVRQIGKQMLPRILNASMLSTSVFVDRTLILLLSAIVVDKGMVDGLVTQYFQAFQLMMLPLGVFGMSVSTAVFPTLASHVARGRIERARALILERLRSILFLSIPSAVGLMVLALPIIQVLLAHGAFNLNKAEGTAIALVLFAIGLPGHAAVEILARSFYALNDSRTPVFISVGQFLLKILLSLGLIKLFALLGGVQWGMGSLALATSIAGLLEAVALLFLLHRRIGSVLNRDLLMFFGRVMLAAGAMCFILLGLRFILDSVWSTTGPELSSQGSLRGALLTLAKLSIELLLGFLSYLWVTKILGVEELGPIQQLLARLKLL